MHKTLFCFLRILHGVKHRMELNTLNSWTQIKAFLMVLRWLHTCTLHTPHRHYTFTCVVRRTNEWLQSCYDGSRKVPYNRKRRASVVWMYLNVTTISSTTQFRCPLCMCVMLDVEQRNVQSIRMKSYGLNL